MGFFAAPSVSSHVTHATTPRTRSASVALAVGAVALLIGTVALAAETDTTDNDSNAKAVANTGAPEATGAAEATSTQKAPEHAATGSAQATDHHRKADARKTSGKDHKGGATGEEEIIVEGKQPAALTPHCVPVQATGTRLRKTVCTTPAQQKADDKYGEQQAQDYLRRLSQQGTLAPSNPSPYIQSGIP